MQMSENTKKPSGRPLALDASAQSAARNVPSFIARPDGAPLYHGFEILDDVVVGGFTFGKISDFEIEPCDEGDAFVVAPDNSRAGLEWEVSHISYFRQLCAAGPDRWGVWGVSFPYPMTSSENARKNLASLVPELRQRWEQWREADQTK